MPALPKYMDKEDIHVFYCRKSFQCNLYGWGYWSVNIPKSNNEQDGAANALALDIVAFRSSSHTVGKEYSFLM